MPRLKPIIWASAILTLGATAAVSAAGDIERGRQQAAQTCVACHGLDGAGQAAAKFPRLDSLDVGYLTKQLQDLKSGARKNVIMQPFAANLTDQQIADVAAYYAAQTATVASPAATDPALMSLGEKLATRGDWDRHLPACKSCHGPDNQGFGKDFPALAGQHASYIEAQLLAWRNGTRGNDPLNLMLAIAERMTDTDIKAAAAYLAAQPAK
ncbi:MAG TPA: c-type cytochrome [Gammaproteobacteria bacterium]|nr:c-type cytochrome [Gammaproteobacteria bacterium]